MRALTDAIAGAAGAAAGLALPGALACGTSKKHTLSAGSCAGAAALLGSGRGPAARHATAVRLLARPPARPPQRGKTHRSAPRSSRQTCLPGQRTPWEPPCRPCRRSRAAPVSAAPPRRRAACQRGGAARQAARQAGGARRPSRQLWGHIRESAAPGAACSRRMSVPKVSRIRVRVSER